MSTRTRVAQLLVAAALVTGLGAAAAPAYAAPEDFTVDDAADFGTLDHGQFATEIVHVHNDSTTVQTPDVVPQPFPDADFLLYDNACGVPVAAGSFCEVTYAFRSPDAPCS